MRLQVSTGFPTTDGGKSHSCVTPTRFSSSPSAQTISVADGRSETMRGRVPIPHPSPCVVGLTAARLAHPPRTCQGGGAPLFARAPRGYNFGARRYRFRWKDDSLYQLTYCGWG